MSGLDISGVRQVPLYTDYNILEMRKTDGGCDIVRGIFCEQNRRVGSECWVCAERLDEGDAIVFSFVMRDDVSCPSQSKGNRGKSGGEM